MSASILAFSADPGGARCLLPVIRKLNKRLRIVTLARDQALPVFAEAGCRPISFCVENSASEVIEFLPSQALTPSPPALVLTSASSDPDVDMTEKRFWLWAKVHGISSVAVLDQWQNVTRRFCGPGGAALLPYQPSRIAVMDEIVRAELLTQGFAADQVVVTGQPYLEWSVAYARAGEGAGRARVRRQFQIEPGEYVVTFVAEPLAKFYGREVLGFDEFSVLDEVLRLLGSRRHSERPVCVWVKLHSKNRRAEFDPRYTRAVACGLPVQIIQDELSPEETLWGSDLVIGMSSLLLAQAALLGRPVISAQVGAQLGQPDQCYLSQRSLIPRVTNPARLRDLLDQFMHDPDYVQEYLSGLSPMNTYEGAAERVADLCLTLIQTQDRVGLR